MHSTLWCVGATLGSGPRQLQLIMFDSNYIDMQEMSLLHFEYIVPQNFTVACECINYSCEHEMMKGSLPLTTSLGRKLILLMF